MFRIFGPPGTGKTTTLLNMVDKALADGVPSHQIAFLAFTRKAAHEARDRAAERFNLVAKDDLPYFRTLHSLAYRMLGMRDDQTMKPEHFRELSATIGMDLTIIRQDTFADDDIKTSVSDHPILSMITLARLQKKDLRRAYDQSDLNYNWIEVDYVSRAYQKYKETNHLLDYTDMLALFLKEGLQYCPQFKLCFLDEAQDLSPLQWDVAHGLEKKAEKMFVAGDDDQAIYRWAGADVDHFINLPGGSEVLQQSYRVPSTIHALAEKIVSRIGGRFPKTYLPKKERGRVERVFSVLDCDMSKGTWLVLSQARYMLQPLENELRSMGYLFSRFGHRSISEKISMAVNGWEQLRKGEAIDVETVRSIYRYMSGNGKKVARGAKKIIANEDDYFTFKDLKESCGLLAPLDEPWFDALDKLPSVDRAYIVAMLRRGEKFNAVPRINLSTIHQAKGGEADNVVLLLDLSPAALLTTNDDIHRVFYVAVTRAKENLFLVEPEDLMKAYML